MGHLFCKISTFSSFNLIFLFCLLLITLLFSVLSPQSRQDSWELTRRLRSTTYGESKVPWFIHKSRIQNVCIDINLFNLFSSENIKFVKDLKIIYDPIFITNCSSHFHTFFILFHKSNNFTFWDIIFLGQDYFKYWSLR